VRLRFQSPEADPWPKLEFLLRRLGQELAAGKVPPDLLLAAISAVGALPPATITWASTKIADLAGLHAVRDLDPFFFRLVGRSRFPLKQVKREPRLAALFLFHRDGHVREAILHELQELPWTPFFLAALAWRLNDWVLPVRKAALRCMERVQASIPAETIVEASPFLLNCWLDWYRWERENEAAVQTLYEREDVVSLMVRRFAHETTGPLGTDLRMALRSARYDRHLDFLMRDAKHPHVRAAALKMLLADHASWPVGQGCTWIDKPFHVSKLVMVQATRWFGQPLGRVEAMKLAKERLRDRSVAVRRVCADWLIKNWDSVPDKSDIIEKLSADKSTGLRERAAFLKRKTQ